MSDRKFGAVDAFGGEDSGHGRRRPVHFSTKERFDTSSIVFVTICAKDRKKIFCSDEVHELMCRSWIRADHYRVGRYVIMPDHIHFFCAPAMREASLGKWVKYWKALVSKEWPVLDQQPIWQVDYWDRQLRCGEHYSEKWEYVRSNPVRAGLVECADNWPFQGAMNDLRWFGM